MKRYGRSVVSWLGMGVLALGLAGCDTIGSPADLLYGRADSPDEFKVLARKPLKMPGTLDLPEPRLGEPSPLEPDPANDAVVALMGVPSADAAVQASPGERALLDAANVAATSPDVALQLEQTQAELEARQPYDPPSILEVLGSGDPEETRDALDPAAEARRLQREGISTAPVDPNAGTTAAQ